jgi:hypothetical protein
MDISGLVASLWVVVLAGAAVAVLCVIFLFRNIKKRKKCPHCAGKMSLDTSICMNCGVDLAYDSTEKKNADETSSDDRPVDGTIHIRISNGEDYTSENGLKDGQYVYLHTVLSVCPYCGRKMDGNRISVCIHCGFSLLHDEPPDTRKMIKLHVIIDEKYIEPFNVPVNIKTKNNIINIYQLPFKVALFNGNETAVFILDDIYCSYHCIFYDTPWNDNIDRFTHKVCKLFKMKLHTVRAYNDYTERCALCRNLEVIDESEYMEYAEFSEWWQSRPRTGKRKLKRRSLMEKDIVDWEQSPPFEYALEQRKKMQVSQPG